MCETFCRVKLFKTNIILTSFHIRFGFLFVLYFHILFPRNKPPTLILLLDLQFQKRKREFQTGIMIAAWWLHVGSNELMWTTVWISGFPCFSPSTKIAGNEKTLLCTHLPFKITKAADSREKNIRKTNIVHNLQSADSQNSE